MFNLERSLQQSLPPKDCQWDGPASQKPLIRGQTTRGHSWGLVGAALVASISVGLGTPAVVRASSLDGVATLQGSAIAQGGVPAKDGGDRDSPPWVFQTGFLLLCGATTLGTMLWTWSQRRSARRQHHGLQAQLNRAIAYQGVTQRMRDKVAQQLRDLRRELRTEQQDGEQMLTELEEALKTVDQLRDQVRAIEEKQGEVRVDVAATAEEQRWPDLDYQKLERDNHALQGQKEALEAETRHLNQHVQILEQQLKQKKNHQQKKHDQVANSSVDTTISLFSGEHDYYDDEHKAVIHDALEEGMKSVWPDSRRQHILESLLANNDWGTTNRKIREEVGRLFQGYTRMDAKVESGLKKLGFELSSSGSHYKVRFRGDSRYVVTFAKTPSDRRRAGKNTAREIHHRYF